MNRHFLLAGIALLGLAASPAWAQDSFGSQPGMGQQQPYGMQAPQMQMPQQPWGQGGMPGMQQPLPSQMPGGQMMGQPMPGQQMQGQMMPGQGMPGGMGVQPPMQRQGGMQPGFAMPGQPPQAPQPGGPDRLDAMAQMERQDYGVPPPQGLHAGAFHGPTPNTIPGGQVITTKGLIPLMQNQQVPKLVLDILGGPEHLPGAVPAVAASQPGDFRDQTQQGFGNYLNQATRGNKEMPLVFYCLNIQCWMSYNAAARAIAMGYTNVLWYRGGIEAWKSAGLPVQPSQQRQ